MIIGDILFIVVVIFGRVWFLCGLTPIVHVPRDFFKTSLVQKIIDKNADGIWNVNGSENNRQ